MPAIQAVVFDLDDTLYPERAYVASGFRAVAMAHTGRLGDVARTVDAMIALFDTDARSRVFHALLDRFHLPPDEKLVAEMIETYRGHVPTISLHPDADAALSRLRGRCELGILTDGHPLTQSLKLGALVLPKRVDEIIITGALGADFGKPDTRAFERIAAALGVETASCAYVGDNPAKDFIAPNALGWTTIQVSRNDGIYHDRDAPPGGAARFQIDTLNDLDGCLSARPTR